MEKRKIFFHSNVKFLRERKKISQELLAERLGITRAKLAALELGQTKSPQPEDMLNFSELFQVSIDTLLKVDLAKLGELKLRELESGNDVYLKGGNLRVLAISVDKSNNENVDYVPVQAKAGYSSGYNDPEFIASLPRFSFPNLPKGKGYRVFSMTGDSMLPIPSGSDIIGKYLEDWNSIKPDTPCIVVLNGQQDLVFKMVTLQQKGGFLLRSLNPTYEPYEVPVNEVLEIWTFYSFISKEIPAPETDMKELLRMMRRIEEKM